MLKKTTPGRVYRHRRIRAKIFGTKERPRLCVFRSLNHIYAQFIDDEKGRTILTVSSRSIPDPSKGEVLSQPKGKAPKGQVLTGEAVSRGKVLTGEAVSKGNINQARAVGALAAASAKKKGIEKVIFDRAGYVYHGRVKALADAIREGGVKF